MCDINPGGRRGWRGWRGFPVTGATRAKGSWHDLSHRLDNDLPVPHVFPHPHFSRLMSMPEARLNLTKIEMVCHVGTHLDAPLHLFMDGPAFDEIPLEMLHGQGVVWKADLEPFQEITAELLATLKPSLRAGDMLLLCASWSDRWGRDDYMSNPAFTVEAAHWLVEQGVKAVGVDFATPDMALERRPADFDWPVHKVLLSQGTLVAENLANLAPLAGERVEIVFGALNIGGADGSPARILARAIEA